CTPFPYTTLIRSTRGNRLCQFVAVGRKKGRDGETPSPARETRALSNHIYRHTNFRYKLSPVLEEFPRLSTIKPFLFCPDINLRRKRPMHRAFIRNFD